MIRKDIHLAQISEVMKIPYGELRALNPQYRTGLIPGSSKPLSLTLPMSHLGDFIDLHDTIRSYKPDVYLNSTTRIVDPSRSKYFSKVNSMTFTEKQQMNGKTVPSNTSSGGSSLSTEIDGDYITYTVRAGDTIWDIVKLFDNVTTTDVLSLNNITNPDKIQVGQKLKIKKKS